MAKVTYNERSWAIDVISEINIYLSNKDLHIKSAGGEHSVSDTRNSLFPDILLFKDRDKNLILQGWELKMPDTPINDAAFIKNAIQKANILQRDSFVLWNVKNAVLYLQQEDGYRIFKSWEAIDIQRRSDVKPKQNLWVGLLHQILLDLNNFFASGQIQTSSHAEIVSIQAVIDVILTNVDDTAETLRQHIRKNATLEAQINHWWSISCLEYGYKNTDQTEKLTTLSTITLTNWVFKIVFAHILKKYFNPARRIEEVNVNSSIDVALQVFVFISEKCNFWSIFNLHFAQSYIAPSAWQQITQLNHFLSELNIENIDIEVFHQLMQDAVSSFRRKVAGQYATPPKLADLLTRLTITDKTKIVFDPCCGTGTIAKKAYQLKAAYGISQDEILSTIWASDKYTFPLQLANLSLAQPDSFGKILQLFSADAIDLTIGKKINFQDPNNGNSTTRKLPPVDYIVSNLPFVSSKQLKISNPDIAQINTWISEQTNENVKLSGKSDMFAYLPFYFHQLLNNGGKIGLILSNAWIGASYGAMFLDIFQRFFRIEYVLISGEGKWFQNAQVVTTILIAHKKTPSAPVSANHKIRFCTLNQNIETVQNVKQLSEDIILEKSGNSLKINQYTPNQIQKIQTNTGITWMGFFTNLNWLETISEQLIPVNQIFNFIRGERRGQNRMFYPEAGHGIESDYLVPVLRNLRDTKNLICVPNKEAFCCSKSIAELKKLGHTGALNWIQSFEHQTNNTGLPLPQVLEKANLHWYEMTTNSMADFVMNVNAHESLFVAKSQQRGLIDQRMIGLSFKENEQAKKSDIYLALLNSMLSMFLVEASGFGRGQAALDLRSKKMSADFRMLNPSELTPKQKQTILDAFQPILDRNRLALPQEIESPDRVYFEKTLLKIYEIETHYESFKSSLLQLYGIRFAVKR